MADDVKAKRGRPANWTPPKGGTRYPQYALKDALNWAGKLVSKTHLSPQPSDIIFASVVSSKGATAQIKVSALKQYDLLEGSSSAYAATALAKAISSAPTEERQALYEKAALAPAVFKALYDTWHGDDVSLAKLKQRAADLQVHPDKTDHCVSIYVDSMVVAGLVTVEGDSVRHRAVPADDRSSTDEDERIEDVETRKDDVNEDSGNEEKNEQASSGGVAPRAVFHVNVNLDASLDTDKLERHLALLKRYGAI